MNKSPGWRAGRLAILEGKGAIDQHLFDPDRQLGRTGEGGEVLNAIGFKDDDVGIGADLQASAIL